jgi:hypothetical protein
LNGFHDGGSFASRHGPWQRSLREHRKSLLGWSEGLLENTEPEQRCRVGSYATEACLIRVSVPSLVSAPMTKAAAGTICITVVMRRNGSRNHPQ